MTRYRVWRNDSSTAYTYIHAETPDDAIAMLEDGDDSYNWTETRYNAEYDAVDAAKYPHITEDRASGLT